MVLISVWKQKDAEERGAVPTEEEWNSETNGFEMLFDAINATSFFLVETENMELFNAPGFSPQRLGRGSCFQHNSCKLYNTTAVQMGAESKPPALLHPLANYLQGDCMLIKIPLKRFWVVFNPYKTRRNLGSLKAEKQTFSKVSFFIINCEINKASVRNYDAAVDCN